MSPVGDSGLRRGAWRVEAVVTARPRRASSPRPRADSRGAAAACRQAVAPSLGAKTDGSEEEVCFGLAEPVSRGEPNRWSSKCFRSLRRCCVSLQHMAPGNQGPAGSRQFVLLELLVRVRDGIVEQSGEFDAIRLLVESELYDLVVLATAAG